MNKIQKIGLGIAALATLCGGITSARADVTRHFTASASGAWNANGKHVSTSDYQIGHSSEKPVQQAAYFVFDLSSIKGKTVTACSLTIPGSTDGHITTLWPGHGTAPAFKIGIHPQGPNSLSDIMTGNNNVSLYNNATSNSRNQDLGYAWVPDGLHRGLAFDAFHFNPQRLQTEVNAGGRWAFWATDRFDSGGGAENYVWGSTSFNTGIILNITTTN